MAPRQTAVAELLSDHGTKITTTPSPVQFDIPHQQGIPFGQECKLFFLGPKNRKQESTVELLKTQPTFQLKKKKKIDLVGREKAHLEKLNNTVAIYNLCVLHIWSICIKNNNNKAWGI